MFAKQFFDELIHLENQILETQLTNIQVAADRITQSLMGGGVVHLFGIGHSFTPSKEAFFRKGGLVPVNPIYDANLLGPFGGVSKIIALERLEDYGRIIFEGHDVRPGEVFVQFSITGASSLTVEIALEAKRRGLFTIAVTNVAYSRELPAKHSNGKHLYEVVDLVIDNCGKVGDATIEVPGWNNGMRAGATATITAMVIWNMTFLQVIENYIQAGKKPPVIIPTTFEGAAEWNQELFDQYRSRLARQF